MSDKQAARKAISTATRTFSVDEITRESLELVLAEARDAGVPAHATVTILQGSVAALAAALTGKDTSQPSVTFSWEG